MDVSERLQNELHTFETLWRGGYYEGNPLDPLAPSGYGEWGYISVLHAVFVHCIKPYVSRHTVVLEIGPGRGAWTKTMLQAKEVWCLDPKSRNDNGIDDYLGHPKHLTYLQIKDFSCNELPAEKFDYLFSFGALCHVSWDGIAQYARNLYPKLRNGAHAFWMIADYDKSNRMRKEPWKYDVISRLRSAKRMRKLRMLDRLLGHTFGRHSFILDSLSDVKRLRLERVLGSRLVFRQRAPFKDTGEDMEPHAGRWFHAGTERTTQMLEDIGYIVVEKDIELICRDPIIHFRKP